MKKTLLLLLFLTLNLVSNAQTFEIRAKSKGGSVIGIELRETSGSGTPTTANFVTDIVFGLKWLSTYNITLSTPTGSYNITKSGTETIQGSYKFQAYYAANTPFSVPTNWTTNTWIEIASITSSSNGSQSAGTFEICENGFNPTTNPNVGIDLSDFTPIINGSASNVVLPIELLSFTANKQNTTAQLNWLTAHEENTQCFDIEKSTDAKTWTKIGTHKASNSNNYRFGDEKAFATASSVYYRLKIVDIDGTFKYSPIRSLTNEQKATMKLYPNPTKDIVTIELSKVIENTPIDLIVQDIAGKTLLTRRITTPQYQLDISQFPKGVYLVQAIDNAGKYNIVEKLTIQ